MNGRLACGNLAFVVLAAVVTAIRMRFFLSQKPTPYRAWRIAVLKACFYSTVRYALSV